MIKGKHIPRKSAFICCFSILSSTAASATQVTNLVRATATEVVEGGEEGEARAPCEYH